MRILDEIKWMVNGIICNNEYFFWVIKIRGSIQCYTCKPRNYWVIHQAILVELMPFNIFAIFFFYLHGCPGQLTLTTINSTAHWTPCKPSGQVRHRGDDRRAHEGSNPGAVERDNLLPPLGQDPHCHICNICMLFKWPVIDKLGSYFRSRVLFMI